MKTLKYLIISLLACLALYSCSIGELDYVTARGEGVLSFNFDYDLEAEVVSKAGETSELVFRVEVIDMKTGVSIRTVEDHRELKNTQITLREGTYKIVASNGKQVEAAFDAPYYEGSETIEVVANREVTANVVCTLANVKVTVSVTDSVKKYFTEYPIVISNEAPNGALVYAGETLNKEGYFKCTGKLTYTITLKNTDGRVSTISNTISDEVKPRQYYDLRFDVVDDGSTGQGGATLRVTVDGTLIDKDHRVEINLNKDPMPEISEGTGADLKSEIRVPKGAGQIGLFSVTSVAGVERVTVTHNSSAVSALGIPASIDLLSSYYNAYEAQGLVWTAGLSKGSIAFDIDFRELFAEHLNVGTYQFNINVLDRQSQNVTVTLDVVIIPATEVSIISVDPWAEFATIQARYNTETEPTGLAIQYKKSSASSWTNAEGELVKNLNDPAKFSTVITGLTANTQYDFRVVTSSEQLDENMLTVSTESADQLPNFNFDQWYQDDKDWYAAPDMNNIFWDSGNKGANTLSAKNPTSPEETKVVSGKAVKMQTMSVAGVMAGGNIYSGRFGEILGIEGAIVNFGRPYACRPTALHGYYAYTPKVISRYAEDPWTHLEGENDIGKIFVVLADWTAPFKVNNVPGQMNLFDPSDRSVIAYGELEDNVGTPNGEYKEFTINLEYRDDRQPTYVVVVACASKYADYFTGAVGSVMYIDEFEFLFDYDHLTYASN